MASVHRQGEFTGVTVEGSGMGSGGRIVQREAAGPAAPSPLDRNVPPVAS